MRMVTLLSIVCLLGCAIRTERGVYQLRPPAIRFIPAQRVLAVAHKRSEHISPRTEAAPQEAPYEGAPYYMPPMVYNLYPE